MSRPLVLRPRERRLTLIAGVVIGSWALVSLLIQPLWDRARDLALHVETQTEKLDALKRLLGGAPAVDQDYQQLSAYFEQGDVERVQGEFLKDLEALSRASSARMNLKPRPVHREGPSSRFEVELDVEGAQRSLLAFLDGLFRMPKLIHIERLRISAVPGKQDLLRANVVVQRLVIGH